MSSLDHLLSAIHTYLPSTDVTPVRDAYAFSENAHKEQKRLTGEAYVEHSLRVAIILAERLRADIPTIASGILHDVVEDTGFTEEDVERAFGKEVAGLVMGVTSLRKIHYHGIERYIESMRKLFVAAAEDIRVIYIKFADRIDNLETLYVHAPEKSLRIAKETLEIYAPIAHRLSMGEVKGILEDMAFPYVFPKEYALVKQAAIARMEKKERVVDAMKIIVEQRIHEERMTYCSLHGRAKRLYSLYQKIIRHNPDLSKIEETLDGIYDIVALRIIVDAIPQCYAILGLIHSFCTPLIGRIKDYIANPKANGYQSLHTTVWAALTPGGTPEIIEFQIRTQQMHDEAEYGAAVHWHYDEKGRAEKPKRNLGWVQKLTKWTKELKENQQFLESLKVDVLKDRIFVRTPLGDWVDLPRGATPVDFAYHVHTELGNKCIRARVNGVVVALNHELQNRDTCEIITDKKRKGPDPKWLAIVKTSTARTKIREQTKARLFDWWKQGVTPTKKKTKRKKR